jgi:hypothetical protein
MSGLIKLFFGDNFFQMLCKESNQYYFQNQGKYASSSKGGCQCGRIERKRSEERRVGKEC